MILCFDYVELLFLLGLQQGWEKKAELSKLYNTEPTKLHARTREGDDGRGERLPWPTDIDTFGTADQLSLALHSVGHRTILEIGTIL
jgi:hypothetical protein